MPCDLSTQQIGVYRWRKRHEGCSEASAEGGLGFGDPFLRAGHFGGIAGQEVIHGLRRGQFCNGRQHAKSVSREHDDVGGMSTEALQRSIRNMTNGVRSTSIFSERGIVQVEAAGGAVKGHIFEYCPEAARGFIDFRLGLS